MTNRRLLLDAFDNFSKELIEEYKRANAVRVFEFQAAIKIQAWFRGIRLRCYLKFLNGCCVIIQKHWRGYLGRKRYRLILSETVHKMHRHGYHRCATKIQSVWKGFYSRKYYFNYYSRKAYLESIQTIGNIVREQLAQYQREHVRHVEVKEEQNEHAHLWSWAKSHHFCVSTFAQPGVYGSAKGDQVSPMELMLRSVRSELAHEHMQRKPPRTIRNADMSCDKETETSPSTKPQVHRSAQSGSLRRRLGSERWRQAPATLSLQASSDYDSVEKAHQMMREQELLDRIQDEPFHCGPITSPPYQRLLVATGEYGPIPYGTIHFRY